MQNQMTKTDKYKILVNSSIRDAVKKMDEEDMALCVCVDYDDNVVGVISEGDFRRAVHHGIQLDESITEIINKDFIYVRKDYSREEVDNIFNNNTIVLRIPVVENGKLLDVIMAEEFHGTEENKKRRMLDNPVVIMAGGKGARLDPFTRILPKPLIPLGDDPVIKVIMDEFYKFGIGNFYISLRDKERMVRAYFHDHELNYQIKYVHEKKPLGTAGALRFLTEEIKESFFVSNCDIIIRADYGAFYDFHKKGEYDLTMIGSMRQFTIPYGVCDVDPCGALKTIREKPQYDFLVNTGMYLLEPEVLQYIPEDETFNMTDLIARVQENGLRVGIFPVSEKSWIDVGQLSEYKEAVSQLNLKLDT